ncbi:hypothetical protein ELE36_13250 [Pseudolysobacter antarcticus]|uniref:Uncharacterized protein n=1 Tax=Pseudolysobacter antarcticus TaxID=2511995 RepID=A0A411HLF6_9GAMM|nr:hypothetical protein [Pseudolysobacter antarcticus]QBB71244.1 hypothetical protein ELE36_13250 [Pseudolysobacter antarcticus]
MRSLRNVVATTAMLLAISTLATAADKASGSVTLKTTVGMVKYAVLVRGPDEMNSGKTLLRIYLSSADIGAKIKACKTLHCADATLEDGAMVDYSEARHLDYSVKLNGQRMQYSGATDASAFALASGSPNHLVGKLHVDDSAAGGAKIDADFDLTLVSTFTTVR